MDLTLNKISLGSRERGGKRISIDYVNYKWESGNARDTKLMVHHVWWNYSTTCLFHHTNLSYSIRLGGAYTAHTSILSDALLLYPYYYVHASIP